jgi:deoxyribodipyrimidine photo-lyase
VTRLSPYLRHGEASARQAWFAAEAASSPKDREAFRRQLAWRDFSYYILYHNPDTPDQPLKDAFKSFGWEDDAGALRRWKAGETGYPIVDAGMRQLAQTGWMHNRVRMIVASFLTKHLRIHWREGAAWFWQRLVDADLANNTMGWQWVAGSGADAQPFFRIFNPISQGEQYDPVGTYVRRWVPALEDLPTKYVHSPWTAPAGVLSEAGVKLGSTYPNPLVDHKTAREGALEAYRRMKKETADAD